MKEKLISITIIIMAVLAPILIIPSAWGYTYFPKMVVMLSVGVILLILILANYQKLYLNRKDKLLIIYAVLIFLSTIFSSNIKTSIMGATNRYDGMLMLFTYILIYFAVSKFFKKEYIKNFTKIMYVVVFLIGILSILQYYVIKINLPPIFKINKYSGSSGTFGNSNFLGTFVSISLPILMSVYIINGKFKNLLLANVMFITMMICLARSSWVAFALYSFILIIFLLFKKKKDYFKRAVVLIITFVCVFLAISSTGKSNVENKKNIMVNEIKEISTTGVSEKMGSGRILIWKMTIKLIVRNPLLGVGTDNLEKGLASDKDILLNELYDYVVRYNAKIDKAHNNYLHTAATLGIPALFVYMSFIGIIVLKNRKIAFQDNARFVFLLSITSYLVQDFFNISTIGNAPLFWLMLGIICNEDLLKEFNEKIIEQR